MEEADDEFRNFDDVGAVAKLHASERYRSVMQGVDHLLERPEDADIDRAWTGDSEEDPTYTLLLRCNQLAVDIDNEIVNIHNYMKDKYKAKFPELASFVHDAVQYALTIRVIQNEMDLTKVNLESVLPQHVIMGVTVTATTTSGQPLPGETLQRVLDAADMVLKLDADKLKILNLVKQRMHQIAPNLSMAVGEEIAARLMGIAGGLMNLSKMPASNVQVLGAKRKTLSGFSSATAALHQGFIYACDIIQNCPDEFRSRAARLVGAKCTILARVDAYGSDRSGSQGAQLKEEMQKKIEKWQELPPAKTKNVLPVPDLEPKKRRGGKRYRKMKEKYGLTDVQKAANRIKFGEAEEEFLDGEEVVGLGMIGKDGSGKLRRLQARQQQMKMSNKTAKRMAQQAKRGLGNSSMVSGLSSSLAFTPVQGIELENPSARAAAGLDRKEGTESYFSDYAGFKSLHTKPK